MQSAIKITTTVQQDGKVEVSSPELKPGDVVEVIVLTSVKDEKGRKSALDILAEAPGHRIFKSAENVDAYIREERDSWDH